MFRTTSIIVACALGTSVLAAAAMQSGQQRQQQPQQDRTTQQERDYEVATFEGKIVDLYHFMNANDKDRKNLESAAYNGKATGGPVALVVMRDRRILPDTEEVYIILGAPEATGRPATRPGQQPGQRPGQPRDLQPDQQRDPQQPGQRPGQQDTDEYDRDRDDVQRSTGEVPSNEICKRAMQMVGQTVRISGKELERGNLQAIVARNIQPIAGESPADQRRDRERDRERDRDPQR